MIDKALLKLRPGASWILKNDTLTGLTWTDEIQTRPTDEEIEAEIERLQSEYDAKEYQRLREPEYPKLADQLDMLWHAIDENKLDTTSDFYQSLKAVKDKYPKDS